jgi:hypothetical protein
MDPPKGRCRLSRSGSLPRISTSYDHFLGWPTIFENL